MHAPPNKMLKAEVTQASKKTTPSPLIYAEGREGAPTPTLSAHVREIWTSGQGRVPPPDGAAGVRLISAFRLKYWANMYTIHNAGRSGRWTYSSVFSILNFILTRFIYKAYNQGHRRTYKSADDVMIVRSQVSIRCTNFYSLFYTVTG